MLKPDHSRPRTPKRLALSLRSLRIFLLFALTALCFQPAVNKSFGSERGEASFFDLLQKDVELVVQLKNVSALRERWEKHPFQELMTDEIREGFFNPDADSDDNPERFKTVLQEEFGLTQEELLELFPGQYGVAVFNFSDLLLQTEDRPNFAALADFAGDAERLHELMKIQFERNAEAQKEANPEMEHELLTENFMGETLYLDEAYDGEETYIEDGYALVDGVFVLASPASRLRDTVEALKEGSYESLAATPHYRRSLDAGGPGDFRMYVNFASIMPKINQALKAWIENNNGANLGISAQAAEKALSLEALQALYVDLDLIEDGIRGNSGLLFREKAGLLSLVQYGDRPLPEARSIPKDATAASVSVFDFSGMLVTLEQILESTSPAATSIVDNQLQQIKSQTGVDVRAAIFENFKPEMFTAARFGKEGRSDEEKPAFQQVQFIRLVDARALNQALEAFKDMNPGIRPMIKEQEFEGQTIYTFGGQQGAGEIAQEDQMSYVVTRTHFILNSGPLGLLKSVLSGIGNGSSGFWQQAKIERLFERIEQPQPVVTRSYMDVSRQIRQFVGVMEQSGAFNGAGESFDPEVLAEAFAAPVHLVVELAEEKDGFFMNGLLVEEEGEQ